MPADQVLSQEQIDAMLGGGASAPDPVEEVATAPAPVAPAPAPAPAPPPPEPEPMVPEPPPITTRQTAPMSAPAQVGPPVAPGAAADDALLARLDAVERAMAEMKQLLTTTKQELQSEASQRKAIATELADVQTGLTWTIGYRAKETFTCTSCQHVGEVAAPLNCTACGTQNWWGWWPPQP